MADLNDLWTQLRNQMQPGSDDSQPQDSNNSPAQPSTPDYSGIQKNVQSDLVKEQADQQKGYQKAAADAQKQYAQSLKEKGYHVIHDASGNPMTEMSPEGQPLVGVFGSKHRIAPNGDVYDPDTQNPGNFVKNTSTTTDKRGHIIDSAGRTVGVNPDVQTLEDTHNALNQNDAELRTEDHPAIVQANNDVKKAILTHQAAQTPGAIKADGTAITPDDINTLGQQVTAAQAKAAAAKDYRNRKVANDLLLKQITQDKRDIAAGKQLPPERMAAYQNVLTNRAIKDQGPDDTNDTGTEQPATASPATPAQVTPAGAPVPAQPNAALTGENDPGYQAEIAQINQQFGNEGPTKQGAINSARQRYGLPPLSAPSPAAAAPQAPPTTPAATPQQQAADSSIDPNTPAPSPASPAPQPMPPQIAKPAADPAKGRLATVDDVTGMPPADGKALLDESAATIQARAANLQQKQQAIAQPVQEAQASLNQFWSVNNASVSNGDPTAQKFYKDGTPITGPNGEPVAAHLWDKLTGTYDAYNKAIGNFQKNQAVIQPDIDSLNAAQAEHSNALAAFNNQIGADSEAARVKQQADFSAQQDQLQTGLRQQGHSDVADKLKDLGATRDSLMGDLEQRLSSVGVSPDSDEAQAARRSIDQEMSQRQHETMKPVVLPGVAQKIYAAQADAADKKKAEEQKPSNFTGENAYQNPGDPDFQKYLKDAYDTPVDAKVQSALKHYGVTDDDVKPYLEDMAKQDFGRNGKESNVLNDGSVAVNPKNYFRPDQYKAAVGASGGTDEQKQAAMAKFPALQNAASLNLYNELTKADPTIKKEIDAMPVDRDINEDSSWGAMQRERSQAAQEAGLPNVGSGYNQLRDAIQRTQAAGYPVQHFIGTTAEQEGDRAPSMDQQNLIDALTKQKSDAEAGGDAATADKVAKEIAFWRADLDKNGMSAAQWKKQTGEADPAYPATPPQELDPRAQKMAAYMNQGYLDRALDQMKASVRQNVYSTAKAGTGILAAMASSVDTGYRALGLNGLANGEAANSLHQQAIDFNQRSQDNARLEGLLNTGGVLGNVTSGVNKAIGMVPDLALMAGAGGIAKTARFLTNPAMRSAFGGADAAMAEMRAAAATGDVAGMGGAYRNYLKAQGVNEADMGETLMKLSDKFKESGGQVLPGDLIGALADIGDSKVANLIKQQNATGANAAAAYFSGKSGGDTYVDAYQKNLADIDKQGGMSDAEKQQAASAKSILPAILNAAATYGIFRNKPLGGITNSEPETRAMLQKSLWDVAKGVGSQSAADAGKMGLDTLAHSIVAKASYDPQRPVGQIIDDVLSSAMTGGLLGGFTRLVHEAALKTSKGRGTVPPPPVGEAGGPGLPEPEALPPAPNVGAPRGTLDGVDLAESDPSADVLPPELAPAIAPEDRESISRTAMQRASDTELAKMGDTDPVGAQRGDVLRRIASGEDMTKMPVADLQAIGMDRSASGGIVPLKAKDSTPDVYMVKGSDGGMKPVIKDSVLEQLKEEAPATHSLIPMGEREALAKATAEKPPDEPKPATPLKKPAKVKAAPASVPQPSAKEPESSQAAPVEKPTTESQNVPQQASPSDALKQWGRENLRDENKGTVKQFGLLKLATEAMKPYENAFPGVDITENAGSALMLHPSTGRLGINPEALLSALHDAKTVKHASDFIKSALSEEYIHRITTGLEASDPEFSKTLRELWDKLPSSLKTQSGSAYNKKPGAEHANDFTGRHEFLRQYIQAGVEGKQLTEATLREAGLLDHLRKIIAALYRELRKLAKGVKHPELKALLDKLVERFKAEDERLRGGKEQEGAPKPTKEELRKTAIAEAKTKDGNKSSTQLTMTPEQAKPFTDFAKSIPDSELYSAIDPKWSDDARETEPHITTLFGLHDPDPEKASKIIAKTGPITVTLGKTSIFENPDYDVLKVEASGKELHALNARLSKLPNGNTFPDYKPHATIAYLKKGEGTKYAGDTRFEGQKITFPTLTYSPPPKLREAFGRPELPFNKNLSTTPNEPVPSDQRPAAPEQPGPQGNEVAQDAGLDESAATGRQLQTPLEPEEGKGEDVAKPVEVAEKKVEKQISAEPRDAAEVKKELTSALQDHIAALPAEIPMRVDAPTIKNGKKVFHIVPELNGEKSIFVAKEGRDGAWDLERLAEGKYTHISSTGKYFGPQRAAEQFKGDIEDNLRPQRERTVTIDIPGDGTFTLKNARASLEGMLSRVAKMPTKFGPDKTPSMASATPAVDAKNLAELAMRHAGGGPDGGAKAAIAGLRENMANTTPSDKKIHEVAIELLKKELNEPEPEAPADTPSESRESKSESGIQGAEGQTAVSSGGAPKAEIAPEQAPAPAKPRKLTPKNTFEALKKYFTPGKIVPSYFGRDRVIKFETEGTGSWKWKVEVQSVDKEGNDTPGERPRWHSTQPDRKALEKALNSSPQGLSAPATAEPTPESRDEAYMDAVNRGDLLMAQRMVNAAKGISRTDHSIDRGDAHSPAGPEEGAIGYDLTDNGVYPADVYSHNGLRYYGTGEDKMDRQAYSIIHGMKGHPNKQVNIYRAVQKDGPKKIQPGDWVTTVRDYAKEHGRSNISGDFKIIKELVTAKDIYTAGDSWLEWGYHPPEQRNWPRAVMRDADGNVIPLSQRFKAQAGESLSAPGSANRFSDENLGDYEPTEAELAEFRKFHEADEKGSPKYVPGTTIPEMPAGSVGIRNKFTDWQRKMRGLPPRMKTAARGFGRLWSEAMEQIEAEPKIGERLVREINANPRMQVSDVQTAILTHEYLVRSNEQDAAARAVNEAASESDRLVAMERLEDARKSYQEGLDAYNLSGTPNAQALSARRMALKEDFSLAKLEYNQRAGYGGKWPSKEVEKRDLAEISRLHAAMDAKQDQIDKLESEKAKMYSKAQVKKMVDEARGNPKTVIKYRTRKPIIEESYEDKRQRMLDQLKELGLSAPGAAKEIASDKDYLDAVSKGDTETAQRMVNEAAKKAGYKRKLFTGQARGLTEMPQVQRNELPRAHTFLTDDREVAGHYSGAKSRAGDSSDFAAGRKGRTYRVLTKFEKTLDLDEPIDEEYWEKALGGDDFEKHLDSMLYMASDEEIKKLAGTYKIPTQEDGEDRWPRHIRDDIATAMSENPKSKWVQRAIKRAAFEKLGFEWSEQDGEFKNDDDVALDKNASLSDALDEAWGAISGQGYYSQDALSESPTGKMLVLGDDSAVEKFLDEGGYDSYSHNDPEVGGTTYVAHDPSQIKSADPITRDANGRVIPLSERFNPESNSILHASKPESKNAILTGLGEAHYGLGAKDFDDWEAAMHADGVKDLMGKNAKEIFEKSKAAYDKAFSEGLRKKARSQKPEGVLDAMKANYEDNGLIDPAGVRAIAMAHIKAGETDPEEILRKTHESLQQVDPEITEGEVSDAIVGAGKPPSAETDPYKKIFNEVKTQLALLGNIERLEKDEHALRRGRPAEPRSEAVRSLSARLYDLMKASGQETTDPATQLKTALDKLRASLTNRRDDLIRQRDAKKRDIRNPDPVKRTPDLEKLEAEIKDLNAQLDEIDPRVIKEKTPEQIIRNMKRALNRTIGANKRNIASMEKTGKEIPKKPKREIDIDDELRKLTYERDVTRGQIVAMRKEAELSQRPAFKKAMDETSHFFTNMAIGGYHTGVKLAGYDVGKVAELTVGEAIGRLMSIPYTPFAGLMRKADMEGNGGLGKFFGSMPRGLKEAWQQLVTGDSPTRKLNDPTAEAPTRWHDWIGGNLHAAEKAFLLVASEALHFEKLRSQALRDGRKFDEVEGHKEAYEYAKRDALMEKNKIATGASNFIELWAKKDPKTGKTPVWGSIFKTATEVLFTKKIMHVPMNFVAQTAERSPAGLLTGLVKWANWKRKGSPPLAPEEARLMARLIKFGLMGSAFFLYGFFDGKRNAKDRTFGGYYQPGDKRHPDDVSANGLRIGGYTLPSWIAHSPLIELAQMGNTLARVAVHRASKKAEPTGYLRAAIATAFGLVRKAPIIGTIPHVEDMANPQKDVHFWNEVISGLVPAFLANLAEDTDRKTPEGKPSINPLGNEGVKRDAKTTLDAIKTKIPGGRQQVQERYTRPVSKLQQQIQDYNDTVSDPKNQLHMADVSQGTLNKFDTPQNQYKFESRFAELEDQKARTGPTKFKTEGKIKTPIVGSPITPDEIAHPTPATEGKINAIRRSAYEQAKEEMKSALIEQPKPKIKPVKVKIPGS